MAVAPGGFPGSGLLPQPAFQSAGTLPLGPKRLPQPQQLLPVRRPSLRVGFRFLQPCRQHAVVRQRLLQSVPRGPVRRLFFFQGGHRLRSVTQRLFQLFCRPVAGLLCRRLVLPGQLGGLLKLCLPLLQLLGQQAVGAAVRAGSFQLPLQRLQLLPQVLYLLLLQALFLCQIVDHIFFAETAHQRGMKITTFHQAFLFSVLSNTTGFLSNYSTTVKKRKPSFLLLWGK